MAVVPNVAYHISRVFLAVLIIAKLLPRPLVSTD